MPNSHITADTVVHDQSHLEVCLNYPLPPAEAGFRRHKTDFYFFIPKVMAVTPSSYPRDQFYSDITNHTRIHTPYVESSDIQLLKQISHHIDQLNNRTQCDASLSSIIRDVKLFANTLNKRLKEEQNQFAEILDIIDQYREKCVQQTIKPSLSIPYELRQIIILVDEYLSNRTESTLAQISANTESEDVRQRVRCFLDKEIDYRRKCGDRFFIKKSTDAEKEYFFFRQSLLKKVVALPLFLDIKKKKLDNRYRNIVASLGAALAAMWSQFAEHHAYKNTRASDFGFQFIAVAAFAVGVYVFKDRIKDLSKEYVSEKLKGHVPDIRGTIAHQELGITGATSEYVHYVDEKNTSPEVRFLRRLEGRWDVEAPYPDTVLHYHRAVELKGENKHGHISSIKDILRFNFSFFLKHLDDPVKQFTSYDQEDGATTVNFPKVYHLNIVIRMTDEERVYFERYRLIFNRAGIIRLEYLSDKQKLFFTQEAA